MNRKIDDLRRSIRLALALAAIASPLAHAQQAAETVAADDSAPASDAVQLDAIVVTGRSGTTQRSKAETSYSITTIEEDRLRLQAPTSVTEAMKSVPGFWVEASGGEASGNIRARGIPVDGFGSVTLLEDGMPVQHDPALGFLNGDQAFRLDETIERIEVVRGGPSSVFYSNAPAGAVNFIPREVGDSAEGVVKYTVGDYGLNRYDLWYGAPLGGTGSSASAASTASTTASASPVSTPTTAASSASTSASRFERGNLSFDVKRLDDNVALYLGVPMRTYADGDDPRGAGLRRQLRHVRRPGNAHISRCCTGDGSFYDFDNTRGTEVKRDQFTVKFDYELGAGLQAGRGDLRYNDTQTQRNGVFPLQLMSAAAFFRQQSIMDPDCEYSRRYRSAAALRDFAGAGLRRRQPERQRAGRGRRPARRDHAGQGADQRHAPAAQVRVRQPEPRRDPRLLLTRNSTRISIVFPPTSIWTCRTTRACSTWLRSMPTVRRSPR